MSVHMQREIERLKKSILSLSALVEDNVRLAARALLERDEALASEVEARDVEIDRLELEVEEECLKILALHQPVAIDLRYVISSLKINNDLERIGDLAVNLAHKAASLARKQPVEFPIDFGDMAERAQTMLRDCLDAFVNMDASLARQVCAADEKVNELKRKMRARGEEQIQNTPAETVTYNVMIGASRNIERIADHATNISEDVIYMIEGEIVRHRETE